MWRLREQQCSKPGLVLFCTVAASDPSDKLSSQSSIFEPETMNEPLHGADKSSDLYSAAAAAVPLYGFSVRETRFLPSLCLLYLLHVEDLSV